MKDVRVDATGDLRCWNCGARNLVAARTTRSKVMLGLWSLLKEPKLRCVACGEFSDTGHAKPYEGPASRKYRAAYEAEQQLEVERAGLPAAPLPPPPPRPPAV